MQKIYSYEELEGKLKVGMMVSGVPGETNVCVMICNDGSNKQKITEVGNATFCINGCRHGYSEASFLQIDERTIDDLLEGDQLEDEDGDKRTVLAVVGKLVAVSYRDSQDTFFSWYTVSDLKSNNYELITESEPEPIQEVSWKEVCEKFGKEVKIKREE